jgi:hypothetical protein
MAITLPAYMAMIPKSEIKGDAQAVRQLLQKARLNASAIQRPVRVLLDCTPDTRQGSSRPCRLEAQVPVFNSSGAIKAWNLLPGGRVFLHKGTDATYESEPTLKKARFDSFATLFNDFHPMSGGAARTYGVPGKDGFGNDSFVVVFTPSGEAVTYCPLIIRFANRATGEKHNWLLTLVNSTGHIRLVEAPVIS